MLLFVYGQLMDPNKPYNFAVQGEMRQRMRTDPAARFGPEYEGRVFGQLRHVTYQHLKRIQKFEHPQYTLQRVRLYFDQPVYAFADLQSRWDNMEIIPSGKWRMRPGHQRSKANVFG